MTKKEGSKKGKHMAKSRAQKEQAVAELTEAFNGSKLVVLTDYRVLDVPAVSELRANLREQGNRFTVAKNSLVKIALNNSDRSVEDTSTLAGPVGLAFGTDEVGAAKTVHEFAKANNALEILGGIDAEGNVLTADNIVALAKLPSRQELLAQTVGTIAAPLSGFVRVLNGNLTGLVYAIKAVQEKKAA